MTDVFLVLMLPGGGDELQGIKRGLLERADVVAVNQADGPQLERAVRTARDYALGLSLMRGAEAGGAPPVLTCSGQEGRGIDEVWSSLLDRRSRAAADGALAERRRAQRLVWMWSQVEQRVRAALEADASREAQVREVSEAVSAWPAAAERRRRQAAGVARAWRLAGLTRRPGPLRTKRR
jgi:LAO/AO transport system kinase